MRRHRAAALLVAALSASAWLAGPLPASATTGGLVITDQASYLDGDGMTHILGVVHNGTDARQEFVVVNVHFRDAVGTVLDSSFTFTLLPELVPGASSPFQMVTDPPPYASYVLTVSGTEMTGPTDAPLEIHPGATHLDGSDVLHIPGTVVNRSDLGLEFVQVVASVYAGPTLLDVAFGYPASTTLGPHSGSAFELVARGPVSGFTRIVLQASTVEADAAFAATWDDYFDDLGSTPFRPDITWLANARITTGCGGTAFCPTQAVTREQMAAFLVRALDLPATTTDFFTDDDTSPFQADINRLAAAGITTGCGGTAFCPTQAVTREQMAAFLHRVL